MNPNKERAIELTEELELLMGEEGAEKRIAEIKVELKELGVSFEDIWGLHHKTNDDSDSSNDKTSND